jgi:DNA-binding PucR family transcriptional regulator
VAGLIDAQLPELTRMLHAELADSIGELKGDPFILNLLTASIHSNLETLARVVRRDIVMDEVSTPATAQQHARRLAQRGLPPTVLVRAYRLGQRFVLDWAFNEIAHQEPDPRVAFVAAQSFMRITFQLVDIIAENVVHEYDSERERWVTNPVTVRAATVRDLVAGESRDVAAAEGALGYRLRQNHLGVMVWAGDPASSTLDLRKVERLVTRMGESLGSTGQPLVVPKDRSTGWGWIPLGPRADPADAGKALEVLDQADVPLQAALGTPAAGIAGFRVTHREADRARQVAMLAHERGLRLTSFADPGVRAASMLMADLDATRRLVQASLGMLAVDTEKAARLRDTLLTFLEENGSYTATARRLHLHKSTVRYRVERAVAERGRSIHEGRLDLELALVACHWLGPPVLRPGGA